MSARSMAALLLTVAGCGGEQLDEYTCPPDGTALTYKEFGEPFLARWCQGCHGSASGDRQGAPPNYVFDTHDQVLEHRERIFARAAAGNDSMPPGPDDPAEPDRAELAEWLGCGAP
jgi:hypothetical protein